MTIGEFLRTFLLPLFTFVAGLALGHLSALWRDRRKEFNAAAAPVRAYLLGQMNRPTLVSGRPTDAEMDLFRQYLSRRQQDHFTRAWATLSVTRSSQYQGHENGEDRFGDLVPVMAATLECVRFTDMR